MGQSNEVFQPSFGQRDTRATKENNSPLVASDEQFIGEVWAIFRKAQVRCSFDYARTRFPKKLVAELQRAA
ncbi:hypothetical protein XI05_09675 [Bradyrhizobium sp. CCBAU 11357]|nr:hypothetical protein [Bradyrhizobium sp. CCBAU 11357]